MLKIIFVGDQPSRHNVRQDVAFVGAKCFKRLVFWISVIRPDFYICMNVDRDIEKIADLVNYEGFKVVALGLAAQERLRDENIDYVAMPHPSWKNRSLNNANYERDCVVTVYRSVRK